VPANSAQAFPVLPRPRAGGLTLRELRRRLALVILVAVVPALGLAAVMAEVHRREVLAWAERELRQLAADGADRQAAVLGRVLRQASERSAAVGSFCAALMRGDEVAGVTVLDAEGQVACHAGAGPADEEGRGGTVRLASGAKGGVVLGTGHGSGLGAAWRVEEPGRAVVALTLARLPQEGPPAWRSVLRSMVVDPDDGAVLAAWPDGGAGRHVGSPRLMFAMRSEPGGGSVVSRGADGAAMLFGFAPIVVGGVGERPAVFVAGLPQAVLEAEAAARRNGQMLMFALAGMAGGAGAWMLGGRVLVRPWREGRGAEVPGMAPGPAGALLRHQADLGLALTYSGEVVLRLDASWRVLFASPSAQRVLGYAPGEVVGANLAGEPEWDACRAMLAALVRDGGDGACEFAARRKDDSEVWLRVRAARLADGGFVLACRDVTAERVTRQRLDEALARLAEVAQEDPATGLANRRRFEQVLAQEVRRARRVQEPLAVILVRLGARPASDGARMLREGAAVLAGALRRPGDVAARIDEDVFALLLPTTDRIGAGRVAERVRDALVAAWAPAVPFGIGACSVLPLEEGMGDAAILGLARGALASAGGGRIVLAPAEGAAVAELAAGATMDRVG